MSPLAIAVYQILRFRVPKPVPRKALLTYGELVADLFSYDEAPRDLSTRDPRLEDALADLTRACRTDKLPTIAALVIHAETRAPSDAYFALAHPNTATPNTATPATADPEAHTAAWNAELREVAMTFYPATLTSMPAPT